MIETILITLIQVYIVILIIRSVMTWLPNIDRSNPLVRFIFDATEPVLRRVREALPPQGGIDFSPMVVLIALYVLEIVIQRVF